MPKSRKKKVKHQDFQKVKLKVGRRLEKAQNETSTHFKSRSVIVREQFKCNDGRETTGPVAAKYKRVNLQVR